MSLARRCMSKEALLAARLAALTAFLAGIGIGFWLSSIIGQNTTTTIEKADKADRRPS